MSEPLRLVVPIRTSKRKSGAQSPRQQKDAAQACANEHGYEIVAVLDSGRSESGKTMDRETINTAMAMVRAGEADGILLPAVDRFGRAPIEEMMGVARELHRIGVLVPADAGGRPIDLDDPTAETNLVLQFQMARQYWSTRARGALTSRTNAVTEGKYVASAPKGFDKRAGKLEQNADAELMRRVFLSAATGSLHGAQALLRERWPGERWDVNRVRRLLASPAYKGWSKSGELVNREAHKEIVSPDEWDAAQNAPRARRRNGSYPLSGVAVSTDGEPLVGQLQTVPGRANGPYRRLRTVENDCSINATKLEDYVLALLGHELKRAGFRERFTPGDVEAARREHEHAKQAKRRFVQTVPADDEDYPAGYRAHVKRLRAAGERLAELRGQAARFAVLPSADDLTFERDERGHPVGAAAFELAIRLAVERVVIRPGRGAIADRVVDVVWKLDDLDLDAGATLAA